MVKFSSGGSRYNRVFMKAVKTVNNLECKQRDALAK
jgi:hypothetical protein